VRRSFPTWLLERLVADWGEAEGAGAGRRHEPPAPPLAIRVNTLKISRDALHRAAGE
jgi:16S rRNA C967 or C1407 C5-methylase (RsmB/RsmF family)